VKVVLLKNTYAVILCLVVMDMKFLLFFKFNGHKVLALFQIHSCSPKPLEDTDSYQNYNQHPESVMNNGAVAKLI
jgi:hypothetical protein